MSLLRRDRELLRKHKYWVTLTFTKELVGPQTLLPSPHIVVPYDLLPETLVCIRDGKRRFQCGTLKMQRVAGGLRVWTPPAYARDMGGLRVTTVMTVQEDGTPNLHRWDFANDPPPMFAKAQVIAIGEDAQVDAAFLERPVAAWLEGGLCRTLSRNTFVQIEMDTADNVAKFVAGGASVMASVL